MPIYDWDYKWLGSSRSKVTASSTNLHYFSTVEKPGYRRVNCFVNDKQSQGKKGNNAHIMKMFYKITEAKNTNISQQKNIEEKPIDLSVLVRAEQQKKQIQFSTQLINKSTWVNKYMPKRYVDLLSEERHNRLVLAWAKKWDRMVFRNKENSSKNLISSSKFKFGQANKIVEQTQKDETSHHKEQLDETKLILLAGPPGCGKTTLARIVAKHCGYNYMQINASDNRSAKAVIRRIDDMASTQSISEKPTFIIIDQVDGILETQANGIKQIINYIQTGEIAGQKNKKNKQKGTEKSLHIKRPLIFICNDPFVKGLKQLRKKCYTVYMQKIRSESIIDKLKSICEAEDINVQRDALNKIADLNQNDIRGSLAMLEFVIKTKEFGHKPTSKIIQSIQWDIKDVSKSPINFIEKLMLNIHVKKNTDYSTLSNRLNDTESGPAVTLYTLFHNLKNSRTVLRHSSKMPELLDIICQADITITKSFGNQGAMAPLFTVPYFYFKNNFKAEDNLTKVQFPISFFEGLSKSKQHKKKVKCLLQGFHNSLKPFYTLSTLNTYIIKTLYLAIQTTKNIQPQLIRCLKIMITYGIKFSPYEEEVYDPPLDSMLTIGRRKPEHILTFTGRTLMKNNYKSIKENVQNSKNNEMQEQISWKVASNLKKRRGGGEGIQYKYCEGTGTQIKYVLKLSYFM